MSKPISQNLVKAWRKAVNGYGGASPFIALADEKFKRGFYVEALSAYLAANNQEALPAPAQNRLAWCYLYLGQPSEALQILEKMKEADILAIARALREVGEPKKGLEILKTGKDEPNIILERGLCLEALGDATAKEQFDTLKFDHPDFIDEVFKAADQFITMDYFAEAAKTLNAMEKFARHDAELFFDLGQRYFLMNLAEDAERVLRRGISYRPLPKIYQELASFYERTNHLDQALNFIRVPLQSVPDDPALNVALSKILIRKGDYETALEGLQKVESDDLPAQLLADLKGLRGKALEKLGRFGAAYAVFSTAKDAYRDTDDYKALKLDTPYSHARAFEGVDLSVLKNRKTVPGSVKAPKTMVFFMGFPRSGTTLMQTILDSHEKTALLEEKPVLATPIRAIKGLGKGYPAEVVNLSEAEISYLWDLYLREAGHFIDFDGTTTLIDKLPLHILHLPFIKTLFPESKIIFALRHPKAAAWSCLVQHFALNNSMGHFFSLSEIAKFYDMAMGFWKKAEKEMALDHYTVRYDDLVSDLEGTIKAACAYLDLEFTPDMLGYADKARDKGLINTPSYSQVVKPIYKDSLDHWKHYQSWFKSEAPELDKWCEIFGYSVD